MMVNSGKAPGSAGSRLTSQERAKESEGYGAKFYDYMFMDFASISDLMIGFFYVVLSCFIGYFYKIPVTIGPPVEIFPLTDFGKVDFNPSGFSVLDNGKIRELKLF